MEKIKYNITLANYFAGKPLYLDETTQKKPNTRKLVEQPWQQTKGEMWDEVTDTLCDVFFIEARAKLEMLDIQQEEFNKVIALIDNTENLKCMNDYYNVFMQQKHNLKKYPELTFQQFYNELQWKEGKTKRIIEDSKKTLLSGGRFFLHQYRKPQITKSNLILTLSGHIGRVSSCYFSPDGKLIISGSEDCVSWKTFKTIKIWNAETGRELFSLSDYKSGIESFKFSPDRKFFVSASYDGTLKLWDTKTFKETYSLVGHTTRVFFWTSSSDGKRILSASKDGTIRIWDTYSGKELAIIPGKYLEPINYTPFGIFKFSPDDKTVLSVEYNKIKLWDTETGRSLASLYGHTENISACKFSPDGKFILSAYFDGTVQLWDLITKKERMKLKGHSLNVNYCSFSPDGKHFYTASIDNTIKIWDTKTGCELAKLFYSATDGYNVWGNGLIPANGFFKFSPDRSLILSVIREKIKLWDSKTGKELACLNYHKNNIRKCIFSPDGKKILSADDTKMKLWDSKTGLELANLDGHIDERSICVFSPDGKKILSVANTKMKLWNSETGQELASLDGHTDKINTCAFSPDSKKIISGSNDTTIKLWNSEESRELTKLGGHQSSVNCCTFSLNSKIVATASSDSIIKVWDVQTGKELKILIGTNNGIKDCKLSPDAKIIASLGTDNVTLKLWDVETCKELIIMSGAGRKLKTLSGELVDNDSPMKPSEVRFGRNGVGLNCTFSPDGKRIVAPLEYYNLSSVGRQTSYVLVVWDTETRKELFHLNGHENSISSFAFSPDGRWLVSASRDTSLLWDAETGKKLATLTGYVRNDTRCAFSPVEKKILTLTGINSNTLKYLDIETGKELAKFLSEYKVTSFALSGNDEKLVFGDEGGNVFFGNIEGFKNERIVVTPVRLWLFGEVGASKWNEEITYHCSNCNSYQPLTSDILKTINELKPNYKITDLQNCKQKEKDCEVNKLISKCPICSEKILFNSYITDNKTNNNQKAGKILICPGCLSPEVVISKNKRILKTEQKVIFEEIYILKKKRRTIIISNIIALLLLLLSFWFLILVFILLCWTFLFLKYQRSLNYCPYCRRYFH